MLGPAASIARRIGIIAAGRPSVRVSVGRSICGRSNGTNGLSCEFGLEPNDTYRFILKDAVQGLPLAILDGQPLGGAGGA